VNELAAFLFATVISLWGSLQLGVVNVNVIYCTLYNHKGSARMMALGGVLPELLYSGIAFWAVEMLQNDEHLFELIKVSAVPLLIGMGLYLFFQKPKPIDEPFNYKGSFFKGLVLALLNPQLITFWFAWILVAYEFINFDQFTLISPKYTFILGTAFGAFLMLMVFIWLTKKYRSQVIKWIEKLQLHKVIGGIFIAVALVLLYDYLF